MKYEYGAMVVWYCCEKMEVLGKKFLSVSGAPKQGGGELSGCSPSQIQISKETLIL
jgi:hypothetical protein